MFFHLYSHECWRIKCSWKIKDCHSARLFKWSFSIIHHGFPDPQQKLPGRFPPSLTKSRLDWNGSHLWFRSSSSCWSSLKVGGVKAPQVKILHLLGLILVGWIYGNGRMLSDMIHMTHMALFKECWNLATLRFNGPKWLLFSASNLEMQATIVTDFALPLLRMVGSSKTLQPLHVTRGQVALKWKMAVFERKILLEIHPFSTEPWLWEKG